MERVEVLLQKLQDQYQRKASPEQLLVTVQMLQAELLLQKNFATMPGVQSKISVILPGKVQINAESHSGTNGFEKIIEVLQVDEKEIEAELEQLKQAAELKKDLSIKGRSPAPVNFDPMEEVPTLASQPVVPSPQQQRDLQVLENDKRVELNDRVPKEEASLNEKYKEAKAEISEKLKDTPIRDLKRAMGINDRYLFINDLFNGDEAMFERSLKTLNNFSILPEAEFWMQRELRMKLGWKDDHILVQQFVQLVRRRFA
jgi:hypothetical protein